MNKKMHRKVGYFSHDKLITQSQLKAINDPILGDFSALWQWMDKQRIYGIVEGESDYPWKIKKCQSPPHLFYYQGDLKILEKPILAIVGPRKMSDYGKMILDQLFLFLSEYDLVTVSGMAPGVDTYCHELSLRYNIPTIAILGGGFGSFLRGTKRSLIGKIETAGGLVISEYKHSFTPTVRSFPQRNRLIAGVADLVFLPEAKKESGSLITADVANKMNIPIYSPMNTIFAEESLGTNAYIVTGKIHPLNNLQSFLQKYFSPRSSAEKIKTYISHALSENQESIMVLISASGSATIDLLMQKLGLTTETILSEIIHLELYGYVYESSPGVYRKIICNEEGKL